MFLIKEFFSVPLRRSNDLRRIKLILINRNDGWFCIGTRTYFHDDDCLLQSKLRMFRSIYQVTKRHWNTQYPLISQSYFRLFHSDYLRRIVFCKPNKIMKKKKVKNISLFFSNLGRNVDLFFTVWKLAEQKRDILSLSRGWLGLANQIKYRSISSQKKETSWILIILLP